MPAGKNRIPDRTVARLVTYRRLLARSFEQGIRMMASHELAEQARVTAAQVRRDLMHLGPFGTPSHGYPVEELLAGLRGLLDVRGGQGVALVGLGNLGKAILAYFANRDTRLCIKAAFDVEVARSVAVYGDCLCHPVAEMENVIRQMGLRLAIIAVPSRAAQDTADRLVRAGVRGILNFAPVPLRVPEGVYVDTLDISTALEKVAFFALKAPGKTEPARVARPLDEALASVCAAVI